MIVVLRPVLPPPSQPCLHDRDVPHAVFVGHVVGCCEPMPAGADDDGVILRPSARANAIAPATRGCR